jgi:hypothetical protein
LGRIQCRVLLPPRPRSRYFSSCTRHSGISHQKKLTNKRLASRAGEKEHDPISVSLPPFSKPIITLLKHSANRQCNFHKTRHFLSTLKDLFRIPDVIYTSSSILYFALQMPFAFRLTVPVLIGKEQVEPIGMEMNSLISYVRFEVFTSVTMKNGVLWEVTPCGYCKNRRFGGT